ncbi:hypothetical protein GKR50_16585 [Providencia rustigianii]|uniref:hypothetical protein n=1 Tax=Providencia rustigianii TaxID=158850 RepID=UPI000F6F933B|nr:hypothetical protein [Providencia rustigianii]MTC61598.1 hypothetical protein [Providencia rustigianii]VEH54872.1 Uncharacterised protein [Providencia rustigianii]
MLAKYILQAVSHSKICHLILDENNKDALSEVNQRIRKWQFQNGVILQCLEETELNIAECDSQCPEHWIIWEVIKTNGEPILPVRKEFFSLCQQKFWLKMQLSEDTLIKY